MRATPRSAGIAREFIGFDGGDCPGFGQRSKQDKKSRESTNVRIKDMQATAAIALLLMSVNIQPALAQAGVAPSGAAPQSSSSSAQPAAGMTQSNLPPAPKGQ